MDNKDMERLKNFMLFKVYATDEEFSAMAPILGGVIFTILAIVGIAFLIFRF